MTIFFEGNDFKYEMENVARLFFPLRRFSFGYAPEEEPAEDCLVFIRKETEGGWTLTVKVRTDSFSEDAVSFVPFGEKGENDCEMEFARMLYRLLQKATRCDAQVGRPYGDPAGKTAAVRYGFRREPGRGYGGDAGGGLVSEEKIRLTMQIAERAEGASFRSAAQ